MLAHGGTPDEQVALLVVVAGLWIGWAGLSRLRGRAFPRLPLSGAWVLSGLGAAIMVGGLTLPRQFMRPNPTSDRVGVRPASTATLTIQQPATGEDTHGAQVEVVMELTGGRVIDTATTTLTPDAGHIHLSLDGRLVSMTYGVVQLVDLTGVTPGSHMLRAEFVAADHGPFNPRVVSTVRFITGGAT